MFILLNRLDKKLKSNEELFEKEIEKLRNDKSNLEQLYQMTEYEYNKIKCEFDQKDNFKNSFELKEENFKLLQYEYEEKIIQVIIVDLRRVTKKFVFLNNMLFKARRRC